jgi:hypothetical protein
MWYGGQQKLCWSLSSDNVNYRDLYNACILIRQCSDRHNWEEQMDRRRFLTTTAAVAAASKPDGSGFQIQCW